MKIAYLTTRFPALSEAFIPREIESLISFGVKVVTYSSRRPYSTQIPLVCKESIDQTFYLFPPNWLYFGFANLVWFFRNPIKYFEIFKTLLTQPHKKLKNRLLSFLHFFEGIYLASNLEKEGVEHVHVHLASGAVTVASVATKLIGIKYSFTAHGSALLLEPVILNYKVKNASFVIAVSQYNRDYIIKKIGTCMNDKVHVIHCGIDTEIYRLKNRFKVAQKTLTFLNVGRMIPQKAQHLLIEAFAQLRHSNIQLRLIIVGEGPSRSLIEEYITHFAVEDKVNIKEFMPLEKVKILYNEADIFIMSSISEGIPIVLMEAMSCGLPVIATRITGIPELIENGVDGLLVESENVPDLTEKMMELVKDSDLRSRLGIRGREKIKKKFDIHNNTRKLYTLFCKEINGVN